MRVDVGFGEGSGNLVLDQSTTGFEIVRFWRACDKLNGPFGAVCKLLLLTGCRKNEIAKLRYHELVGETLHLPATPDQEQEAASNPIAAAGAANHQGPAAD